MTSSNNIKYLIVDVETTIFQHGNPYSRQNKLCQVGIRTDQGKAYIFDVEYSDHAYKEQLNQIQELINQTNLLIIFNGKFDLAWLRRYGIDYSHCRIFDCQLCAFILSGQSYSFPSLDGVAEGFGLGSKLDVVKTEYWDKGIDTPLIPYSILSEYLEKDLELTHEVYLNQVKVLQSLSPEINRLISLSNQDLLVLLEMEYNGLVFDFQGMEQAAAKVTTQIESILHDLRSTYWNIPSSLLNFNSGDVLSALLYGGRLTEVIRTQIGVYKSGIKTGEPRYKCDLKTHDLPRQVEPPKGSELKKEGFYATNEATLRSIKASGPLKKQIENILTLSKLEKLNGTYYLGLKKLHEEKDWEDGVIHGQFNQCVARTGRLSSSAPNLQNFPPEIDSYTITRYS